METVQYSPSSLPNQEGRARRASGIGAARNYKHRIGSCQDLNSHCQALEARTASPTGLGHAVKVLCIGWIAAVAVLEWLAMPQPSLFKKRWPTALPPAMSSQLFTAARKAAKQPAAMTYTYCRWPNCQRS
jgi:hypothetical protein